MSRFEDISRRVGYERDTPEVQKSVAQIDRQWLYDELIKTRQDLDKARATIAGLRAHIDEENAV